MQLLTEPMDADSWDKIDEPGYLKNMIILIFYITLDTYCKM